MKFYNLIGNAALGSRLRRLSHIITSDAKKTYKLYGVDMHPHWFPVFFMLMTKDKQAISNIAEQTGLARSAVSKIAKEMKISNLISFSKKKSDSRVTVLSLTSLGENIVKKLNLQIIDVSRSIDNLFLESGIDLWNDLDAIEQALERKGMHERVQEVIRKRELGVIKIKTFNKSYTDDFKKLNLEWIQEYWEPEAKDFEVLNNPNKAIIEKGGYITVATRNDIVVGTCALVKINSNKYELVKLVVKKYFRKKGIGRKLCENIIQKSCELGAKELVVECNSVLVSAISLYEKLGFEYMPCTSSSYDRCNIQMQLNLKY